jgi:hypothetical protein
MFTRVLAVLLSAACCFCACSDNASPPARDSGQATAGAGGSSAGATSDHAGAENAGAADADDSGLGGAAEEPPGGASSGGSDAPVEGAFFLPTEVPTNTAAPRVEVDAQGGTHFLYPAFAIGDAFYGYCAAGCAGPDDVATVRLETRGSVTNAALTLDAAGRPRVVLATFTSVYYASCDSDCTRAEGWRVSKIIDHGSDYEVTGESLALQGGKPRFLMHAYRKFLGAFQKPETFYVTCDSGCQDPESWQSHSISSQLWEGSSLRFDAQGTAHVATVVQVVPEDGGAMSKIAGYFECASDCAVGESWQGIGVDHAYERTTADPRVEASVSLALTGAGAPRVIVLGEDDDGARISYHECDVDCLDYAGWAPFMRLTDAIGFGAGIDLALDREDQPRIVFTSGYNIVLTQCSQAHCTDDDAEWTFSNVEKASSMTPDDIITWPNCTVSTWMLHSPSLSLSAEGAPRIGYQARDVSGGTRTPDPTKPACSAGTDMSLSRALLR